MREKEKRNNNESVACTLFDNTFYYKIFTVTNYDYFPSDIAPLISLTDYYDVEDRSNAHMR